MFRFLQLLGQNGSKHTDIVFIQAVDIPLLLTGRLLFRPDLHTGYLESSAQYFIDRVLFRLVVDKVGIVRFSSSINRDVQQNPVINSRLEGIPQQKIHIALHLEQLLFNHGISAELAEADKPGITFSAAEQEKYLHYRLQLKEAINIRQHLAEKDIGQRGHLDPRRETLETASWHMLKYLYYRVPTSTTVLSKLSNLVVSCINLSGTSPVGPLRFLAIII